MTCRNIVEALMRAEARPLLLTVPMSYDPVVKDSEWWTGILQRDDEVIWAHLDALTYLPVEVSRTRIGDELMLVDFHMLSVSDEGEAAALW